jgi:hypothetical protein
MMSQMQELVSRVNDALPGPWNKKAGRPKLCGLYEAVETTCMYIRHNATQELLGDLRDASQSTVSRMVSTLTPLVKAVLEEFVPDAAEAINMVNGRACLIDGTITPCWSYGDHPELWSRKHGTTGFNAQLLSLLDGTAIYISDPLRARLMTRRPSRTRPSQTSSLTPAARSAIKATKDMLRRLPGKSHQVDSSANPTKKATPKSRRCEHLSRESSHISSRGGCSTPTTAVPITPTATRMTPLEDYSSSQLHGVLNNAHTRR